MSRRIYLDHASAAPVSKHAERAFLKSLSAYGNPSAAHQEGRAAKEVLEAARLSIARLVEVKPEAIIFTSGATEANALALNGVLNGKQRPHVLYCPTSHSSVLEALTHMDVESEPLHLTEGGGVDMHALEKQLRPDTVLVSVPAVESETGTRYDTREMRRVLDRVSPGILLHVDAAQLPTSSSIQRVRLGADLMTLDAQKVGGVRGIGCLVAPRHIPLTPLIYGGGQERGMRSGSEPSALAASFAAALEEREKSRSEFTTRSLQMRETLLQELKDIQGLVVNGVDQVSHILNLSLRGRDTDYLVALLDEAGYAVSTRSACETDAEGSRVVLAMTGDEERSRSTLRVSWGPEIRGSDLKKFAQSLKREVAFLDLHCK